MNSHILFVNGCVTQIGSESDCHADALDLIDSNPFRVRHAGRVATVRIVLNDDRQTLASTYDVRVLAAPVTPPRIDMLAMVSAILTNTVRKQ